MQAQVVCVGRFMQPVQTKHHGSRYISNSASAVHQANDITEQPKYTGQMEVRCNAKPNMFKAAEGSTRSYEAVQPRQTASIRCCQADDLDYCNVQAKHHADQKHHDFQTA